MSVYVSVCGLALVPLTVVPSICLRPFRWRLQVFEEQMLWRVSATQHARTLPHAHAGVIGITLNTDHGEPYSSSDADVAAAQRFMEFQAAWCVNYDGVACECVRE